MERKTKKPASGAAGEDAPRKKAAKTELRPSLREGKSTYDVSLPIAPVEELVESGATRTEVVNEALRRVGTGTVDAPVRARVNAVVDPARFELASGIALAKKVPLRTLVEAAVEEMVDENWTPKVPKK